MNNLQPGISRGPLRWLRAACTRAAIPVIVAMGLAPATATAQPRPAGKPAASSRELSLPSVDTWELDNGMKVAFMHVDTAPVVAVQVWYHVGAKDEPRDRRGSAHMFEHIMFKGTQNVPPEEHARLLNRVGGYVNAATTEDATFYIDVVPKDYLDFAVKLEAERMRKLLFRADMIKTEREVVKEEIRQQENNPVAKGFLRFLEIAYTKHPYAWTAGGTIADLDATTPADLERFYNTYYVPNNAMLVVVGDVTRDQVEAAARTWFGGIARSTEPPPRPADAAPEPAQTQLRREVVAPSQIGVLIGGYHVPEAKHDDIYALQVASLVLGAGESSRLHKRLVRKDKLAVQAGADVLVRAHPGLFLLFGVYLDPGAGDKVEAALEDEIEALEQTPLAAAELRKAKNQLQSAFVFSLQGAQGMARQIGSSWILTGDPGSWLSSLEKYEAVTAADIQRVARTYLNPDNLTVVVIPPAQN